MRRAGANRAGACRELAAHRRRSPDRPEDAAPRQRSESRQPGPARGKLTRRRPDARAMRSRLSSSTVLPKAFIALYAYVLALELWHDWLRLHLAMSASGYRAAGYAVSGYFASYSDGFIRRGLPGEVFALVATPTH